jgi:hypothetical protein
MSPSPRLYSAFLKLLCRKTLLPDFRDANDLDTILARFLPAADLIMLEHELVYGDQPPRQMAELEL